MLKIPYFKQNRDYTCGPACLRMVLAYYGIQQDEVTLDDAMRYHVIWHKGNQHRASCL